MLINERNDIMTQYGTLITDIGLAQIANAQVTQQKVGLQYIALGDGNGSHYIPTQSQSALVNEVWRGPVANVTIDSMNDNRIIIDGVIPSDVGGFTIREIGIFDEENQLIAVGQYPEKYKPQLNEGITEETLIHFVIETNNADAVELSIDPTIIVASRKYVDERVATVNNNLMELEEDFTTHKDNMESRVANILTHAEYYVDVVNGSDDNDGKTEETAWKTLLYAGLALSNKKLLSNSTSHITLTVKSGTYSNDTLLLSNMHSIGIIFENVVLTTANPSAPSSYNSNILLINLKEANIYGDGVEIRANSSNLNSSKAYYPVFVSNVDKCVVQKLTLDDVDVNVQNTLHPETYGVYALNSYVELRGTLRNIYNGVVTGHGGTVVLYDTLFTNVTRAVAHTGGIISNHNSPTAPSVQIPNNSGLFINKVNELFTIPTFQTLPPPAGFTVSSGYGIQYRKSIDGWVEVFIDLIKISDFTANTQITLGTLPIGYRPQYWHDISTILLYTEGGSVVTNAFANLGIRRDGLISIYTMPGGNFTGARRMYQVVMKYRTNEV